MSYRSVDPSGSTTLQTSLLNNDAHTYVHLIKFEKPSVNTEVAYKAGSKPSRKANTYSYLTDGGFPVTFDDGSTPSDGSSANGNQIYVPGKVLSVGTVSETIEAKATTMTLSLAASALSASASSSFTFTSTTVAGTVDLLAEGFSVGDTVEFSGSGANNGVYVRIDSFSNDNKTFAYTTVSGTVTNQTETYTVSFASEEIASIVASKESTEYSNYLNREVFIYRAHINPATGALIGSPFLIFKGIITGSSFDDNVLKSAKIMWTLTSHWGDFVQVSGRLTSDHAHRGLDVSGVPSEDAVIRPEYIGDLGFKHAEQAINIVATYQTPETRYKLKRKSGLSGLLGGKKLVEYTEMVDRDVDLEFNLGAKYIPVVYGVQKATGIPFFADGDKADAQKVYVAQAISEGPIHGILDLHIDSNPVICINEPDATDRATGGNAAVFCVGRADRGDVLNGGASIDENNDITQQILDEAEVMVETGDAEDIEEAVRIVEMQRGYNSNNISHSDGGAGILHEKKINLESPLDTELQFHAGLPNQAANSFFTVKGVAKQFKVQDILYRDQPGSSYWGPSHQVLDTAYTTMNFTIGDGEFTIPDYEFVVKGRVLDCFNYDHSYSGSGTHTNFKLGQNVTLHKTKDDTQIGSEQVQIIDKWSFYNSAGNLKYRFRLSKNLQLQDVRGDSAGDVKNFYMKSTDGNNHKWYFSAYDAIVEDTQSTPEPIEANSFQNLATINSSIAITAFTVQGQTRYKITGVPTGDPQFKLLGGHVGFDITPSDGGQVTTVTVPYYSRQGTELLFHVGYNYSLQQIKGLLASASSYVMYGADAVKLDNNSSSTNDEYNDLRIKITQIDTSTGNVVQEVTKTIVDYIGSSKVAFLGGALSFRVDSTSEFNYTIFGDTQVADGLDLFPASEDKRVSINPAIQLLDYLTNKRYGKGLDIDNDIDLPSFLSVARSCDEQSKVTIITAGSTAVVGQNYRYPETGDIVFRGTVESKKSFTYNSIAFEEITFKDVIGKIAHRWNDYRAFKPNEVLYYEGTAFTTNISSAQGALVSAATRDSFISSNALDNSSNRFRLAKVGDESNDAVSIVVYLSSAEVYGTASGNPVVRRFSPTGFNRTGYSLYDSDDCKYWVYLGWDEPEQRYVTRHQTNLTVDTAQSVFNNINAMLAQFGGMLRYSNGKYSLALKTGAPANSHFDTDFTAKDISEDEIIGSVKVQDSGSRKTFNALNATIVDPANKFGGRGITFMNSEYLKQDRGVKKQGNYNIPGISNYFNARMNIKQQLDESRYGLTVKFTLDQKGYLLLAGDVIRLTYSRFGWSNKYFRINSLNFQANGLVQVVADEHNDNAYIIDHLESSRGATGLDGGSQGTFVPSIPSTPTAGTAPSQNKSGQIELNWTDGTNFNPKIHRTQIARAPEANSVSAPNTALSNVTIIAEVQTSTFLDSDHERTENSGTGSNQALPTKYDYWVRHIYNTTGTTGTSNPLNKSTSWLSLGEGHALPITQTEISDGITIGSGGITMDTNPGGEPFIMGGMTDFNTGDGFYLGYDSDKYKFAVGSNTGGEKLVYDGTNLTLEGGQFVVTDSGGAAPSISGTTLSGAGILLKNDGDVLFGDSTGSYVFFDESAATLTVKGDVTATSLTLTDGATVGNLNASSIEGVTQASFTSIGATDYNPQINGSRVTWTIPANDTGNNWTHKLVSDYGFVGGAFVSFKINRDNATDSRYMLGLSEDTTGASFNIIDYAIYVLSGEIRAYEHGTNAAQLKSSVDDGDVCTITYDGSFVNYYINQSKIRSVAVTTAFTGPIYAHIAIDNGSTASVEHRIDNLEFGAHASVKHQTEEGVTVSSGGFTLNTNAAIKSGQSAFDTGTGFFLGADSGTTKFSIGNAAADKLTFDGSDLTVTGQITADSGAIGGWTIDANAIFTGTKVTSNAFAAADSITIDGTNQRISTNQFRIDSDGSAHFKGAIEGGTISIGSSNNIFKFDATNGLSLGHATPASAPFRVTIGGDLTATNATITGTITADNLSELAGQPITTLTEGSYTDASMGLLSPRVVLQDEDIDYAVLEDGTNIYINDSVFLQTLAAGTRGTILNADLSAGDILTSNRPVSFHANGHSVPSLAQTGTQFAVLTTREVSQIFRAYAPYSTATVKFVQRTASIGSTAPDFSSPDFTLNLTAQTVGTLTATTTDTTNNYWFIQSDAPIVIMKESSNGIDSSIIRPVAREVFSYDQASIFKFDPSDSSDTITESTATGATSFEYHRSDVPISGSKTGDGDGSDSVNATPWEFFGDTYVVDHELANYQVATIEPAVVTSYYWSGTAWVLFATHDFSAASRTNFLGATEGSNDYNGGTSLGSGAPKPWRFVGTGKFALRTNDRADKEYFPLGYNSKHRIYDTIRAGRILAEDIQAGTITGDNINATDEIRIGSGANSVVLSGSSGQDTRLWAGSADGSAAPFRVSKDGDVFANSATIKGDITATDNINDAASDNVAVMTGSNSTFRFFAGNHVAANAPFRIEKDGTVHATDLILYKDNVPYFNSSEGFTDAALSQIASATATRVQSLTSTLDNDTAYVEITLDEASDIEVDADYSALTIFASDSEEYFGDPSNPIFINIDLVTNNGDTKEQNDGSAGILKPSGSAAQLGRAFKVGEYIRIRLTRVSTDGFTITTGANHSATLISGDTSFDDTEGDYVYLLYQITGTTSNDFDLTFTRDGGSLYTDGTRVHNTLNHTATPNTTTDAKAKLPTSVSIVAQYDTTTDFSSPTSISISPSTFTRVDTLTGSPTDELLVDVELDNFKSEDRIESDVAITRNSGAVQSDGFFGGNATISSLAAGTYYFRVQITLTGGTVAETNRRLTLTDNTGDGFRIDNGAGDQSTAVGDITSVKLDTNDGIQVNAGTTRTETTGQADFSLSLGAITPSSVAPTGAMTLANEQKLIFLKSDGTDDDTSLRKAGGSATRLRYGTNSFIFDSVDDRSLEVRNSDDVAVFTVTPNTTVVNSTVTIAGNLVVQGDTITANTATLNVEDKNITLNYGSGDTSSTADGAGITIQDAVSSSQNATMNWNSTSDSFVFSHEIAVSQTSGQIAEFGDSTFADKYIQIRQGAGLRIGISDSLPDSGGGAVFQALDSKPIAFVTNNTSSFADLTSTDVDFFIDEGTGASIGGTNPVAYVNTSQSYIPSNNAGKWLTISNSGATGSYLNLESNASAEDAQLGAVLWTDQGGNTDAHRQVAAIDAIVVPHSSNQGLAGADLRFWTKQIGAAPPNPRMVILESGKVGIGATNPDKLLVVDGAHAEVVINDTDSSPTPRLRFREQGTTKAQIETLGSELVFSVPNTERMRIDTDGNVGIGTNNPAFLLDVNGTFTARDALVRLWEGATSTSNAIEIGQNRTVDGAVFIDFTTEQGQADFNFRINRGSGANGSTTFRNRGTGAMLFETNLTEAMRIDGSGNVSIGTTGTGENLRVAGTSRFNVTTSNGFLIDANSTVADSPFTGAKIDFDVSGSDTTTGDRTHIGLHIDADSSATGGDTLNEHRLYGLFVEAEASGDSDLVYGSYAFAKATNFGNGNQISALRGSYSLCQPHQDAGIVTAAAGAYNLAQNLASGTGETTNTYGAYNQAQAYSTSSYTSANYYGSFNVAQVTSSNTSDINAVHGVHAEVQFDNDTAADHDVTIDSATVIRALYDENDANDSYTVNTGYLFYAQYQGTKPTTAWGLYIDNADKHYLEGNVEIEGALEVEDAGPNLVIDNTLNTTRGSLLLQESGVTKALVQLRGSNETTLPNTMRVGTDSSSNADLLLITNGGERVRVDVAGNVGIGEIDPERQLHVKSAALVSTKLESTSVLGALVDLQNAATGALNANAYNGLRFYNGDGFRMALSHITESSGAGYVQIGTNWAPDSEVLTVHSSGNVGIGTSNPQYTLDISTTTTNGLRVTDDNSWASIIVDGGGGTDNFLELTNFGNSASGSILRTTGSGHLRLAAGNTEAIRILGTNQRVSIGQTNFTPASVLHVGGTISVGATDAKLQLHEGSSFTPTNGTQKTWAIVENIKNSENLAFRQKGDDTTDRMSFFTQYSGQSSFTERLSIISQTGYVGINETVPSTFLEVGSAGVHGIKLGPDTSDTNNSGRLFFEGDATSAIMHTGTGLSLRTGATLGTSSGTQRLHVGTGSIAASVPFKAPGGTAAAPALYFSTDTNTGLYRVSENVLGFSSAGEVRFKVGDNVVDVSASKLRGTAPNTTSTGTILQGVTPEVAFEAAGDFDYRHYNHLAGADKRLTVSISKNDVAQTVSTSRTIFRGDSNQIQHTLGASSELLIITIEDIPTVTYSAWVGINFGSTTFIAKNVKIETFRNGAWQTECDLTDQLNNTVVRQVANNDADGVQKVRYTLSNPYSSSTLHIRINNVFLIHYNTGRELYGYDVNRYDDTSIYGDLNLLDNNNISLTGSGTGGNSRITFNNTDASWDWYQYQQNNGQLEFTVTGTGGAELVLDTDGSDHNNARLNIGSGAGTLEVGTVKAGNGSSSAPSLTFGTDTNTGIFRAAADEIGFAAGGSEKMRLHGPQLLIGTTDPSNLLSNSTAALAIGSPFVGTGASLNVNGFARFSDGIFISEDGGSNAGNYTGINYSAGKIVATGKSGNGLNAFGAEDGYYVGSSQVITGTRELDNITGLTINNSDNNGVRINTTDTVVDQGFNGVYIDHNCSGSDTATADRSHAALFIDMDSSATGGDTSNEHRMYGIYADVRCTGDSDDINGIYGRVESNNNTSQITSIRGLYGIGINDDSGTGRTAAVKGVEGIAQAGGSGDSSLGETTLYGGLFKGHLLTSQSEDRVSAIYGVHAEVEIDSAVNCSIGTVAAVRADFDNDAGTDVDITNSYLFYGDYQGTISATNAYGIRILDDVLNRFAGEVRSDNKFTVKAFGTQDAPTYTFVGDTDTGMYQAAADDLRFTVGGTYEVQITSGTVNVVNTLRAQTIEVKSNSVATVTDLLFADNANIGATQSMNFIIDTENNTTGNTFTWRKNGPGTTASTEIMKLEEDGDLTLTGDIKLPNTVTQTTASITSTNTAQQVLAEWSATTHNGAKATITAVRGGLVETVEILIANTSSTVNHTQFGSVLVGTGVNFTTYTATISGGNVQLRVTPNASTSTNYTAFVTLT